MTAPGIFFYKLTTDNGGAPCVNNGLLSLAICKPHIRVKARDGDLIFGFAANSLSRDNRVIYAARITETAGDGSYYKNHGFSGRGDRIYRWANGAFHWRASAQHHGPKDLQHDLGEHPEYEKARVLLSVDFRYLGIKGTADYKRQYPAIKQAIESLGRGHRSRPDDNLRNELLALKEWLWAQFDMPVAGQPTSQPNPKVSHRARSAGEC